MSDPLLFDGLLDALHDAGVPIGVNERLAFMKVLSRYDGTSAEEFRDMAASLLSRSAEEATLIREIFDRLYIAPSARREPSLSPPVPESVHRRVRRWLSQQARWILLFVVVNSITADIAVKPPPPPPPPQPTPGPKQPDSAPLSSELRFQRAKERCPAKLAATIQRWPLPAIGLGTLVAITIMVAARRMNRRIVYWSRGLLSKGLAELPGARDYKIAPEAISLQRAAFADMATTLAVAFGGAHRGGSDLDIDQTVDATVRAGLLPTLVHRTRAGLRCAVVLVDQSPENLPFRSKIDAFLETLRQRCTDCTWFYYERNPLRVSTKPTGRLQSIETYAAALRGAPLIVIGMGAAFNVRTAEDRARQEHALEAWPARVLLHPIDDPARWPEGLAIPGAAIATFPLNPAGVRAAAAELIALRSHRTMPRPAGLAGKRTADLDDIWRLFAMLSFVPKPTFVLADTLRRTFLPKAPEEIVLTVKEMIHHGGDARQRSAIDAAVRAFRAEDPDGRRELDVRRFLLGQIVQSRPVDEGSAAYLRWRSDLAIMTVHLARTTEEQRAASTSVLDLAATEVAPELQDDLSHVLADAQRRGDKAAARALRQLLRKGVRRALQAAAARKDRSWTRMHELALMLGALAFSGIVALGMARAEVFTARPVRLDGSTEILWSEGDVKNALCAFDGFYDLLVESHGRTGRTIWGLAVSLPDDAGSSADTPSPGSLIMFELKERPPLRWFRAQTVSSTFIPAGAQNGAMVWLNSGGIRFVVREFDSRPDGLAAMITVRDVETIDLRIMTKSREAAGIYGWTPVLDPRGAVVHFSLDGLQQVLWPDGALLEPGALPELAHDPFIAKHSEWIAPGTSDEIIHRILDPDAERWKQPKRREESGKTCVPPLQDCGGLCVDLSQDTNHCGDCSTGCRADQECAKGTCDCKGRLTDCAGHCVDVKSDDANCGHCGIVCSGGPCEDGICRVADPCPNKTLRCGGRCIDPKTDPLNCGTCAKSCIQSTMSHQCDQGICVGCFKEWRTCEPVLHSDDGCETHITNDPSHCGGCGRACPKPSHAIAICENSVCSAECEKGYHDCNATMVDGCESPTPCDPSETGSGTSF